MAKPNIKDRGVPYTSLQGPFNFPLPDNHIDLCEYNENNKNEPPIPRLNIKINNYSDKVNLPTDNWNKIEYALNKEINDVQELCSAIKYYNRDSGWKFPVLRSLFENELTGEESKLFFKKHLRPIIELALRLNDFFADIPLLTNNQFDDILSLSMSQQQISCLLANAFLCTIQDKAHKDYPHSNFSKLYENNSGDQDVMEKLKCLIVYLKMVTRTTPLGVVTFMRRSVAYNHMPRWADSDLQVGDVPLRVDAQRHIDEAHGLIQMDFANKYLGGGVLGHGSVQEEIRFATCPELIASMLFTEKLYDNEAVMIIGAQRYTKFIGYSRSFTFDGEYTDANYMERQIDLYGRHKIAVLALDALYFRNKYDERKEKSILRELNKAWVGFSFSSGKSSSGLQYPGVATGNWGCGAFNGSTQFKTLIQLMACAQARRPMAYYTYKDEKLMNDFDDIYQIFRRYRTTVGQLYRYLINYGLDQNTSKNNDDLYVYIKNKIQHGNIARSNEEQTRKKEETARKSPDLFSLAEYESTSPQKSAGNDTNSAKEADVQPTPCKRACFTPKSAGTVTCSEISPAVKRKRKITDFFIRKPR